VYLLFPHEHILPSLNNMKSVLILGAGLSNGPMIPYLANHSIKVILASRTLAKAQKMIDGVPNAEAVQADVENDAGMSIIAKLIPTVDGVVSMLPYIHHCKVARLAIEHKKHFFTTSYVSDEMKTLNDEAITAGITMINECGVDPGTDHMSAMRLINRFRSQGGKTTKFLSYCGGLPSPANNTNCLGYKFSWAPRGVLLASRNNAHFLLDGAETDTPAKDLFSTYMKDSIEGVGELHCYPNRDSTKYISVYNLQHVKTMIRGTYRFPGWCDTIHQLVQLGFLSLDAAELGGKTYRSLVAGMVGVEDGEGVEAAALKFLSLAADSVVAANLRWLGIFSTEAVPAGTTTLLDSLCHLMQTRMGYAEGERDMIAMKHTFEAEFDDRVEEWTSSMVYEGQPLPAGPSAMANTVSLPVAIAVRMVLEGKITQRGIVIPIDPEVYNPILDELENVGIKFVEKLVKVTKKSA